MEARGGQNRLLEGFRGWKEAIFAAILTLRPPLGPSLLGASREAFGLDFGGLLGLILEPRARHAIFYKNGTALQREHDF